ncbi:MAG: sterol desaturase family protein [Flavobacteriaceae bacterium]|nr:sterol desaturase family protein [Flavobacteriaceae bacterium]
MKNLMKRFFVIVLVSLSGTLLFIANEQGFDLEAILVIVSAITLVLAFVLEKKMPFRTAWNNNTGDLKTDLSSAVTLVILVEPVIKILLPLLIITAYQNVNAEYSESSLPFFVQVLFVTFLVEFGKYWSHRLHHLQPSLWWLHAMHHSSERLYFINNLRFHPLNYLINSIIGIAPAMLLGFSANSILGYLILTQPLVLMQHANIDFKSGWANYIFSTNEAHRWHHSIISSEANRNYGNALLIWDHVFGTFKAPDGFTQEKRVGLFSSSSCYPANSSYWQQIKSMFVPPC